MTIKYAIFNPATGVYDYSNNKTELVTSIATRALEFYKSHSQGTHYSVVTIDENGWESWTNPNDDSTELTQDIIDNISKNITV